MVSSELRFVWEHQLPLSYLCQGYALPNTLCLLCCSLLIIVYVECSSERSGPSPGQRSVCQDECEVSCSCLIIRDKRSIAVAARYPEMSGLYEASWAEITAESRGVWTHLTSPMNQSLCLTNETEAFVNKLKATLGKKAFSVILYSFGSQYFFPSCV